MRFLKRSISIFRSRIDPNGDLAYLINRSLGRVSIPSSSMTGNDLSKFLADSGDDKIILEFGSGGSTLLLAGTCRLIISVESDRHFLIQVKSELYAKGLQDKGRIYWADIGPTKTYGQPFATMRKLFEKRYRLYALGVFESFPETKNSDIVFVDGRFRVACVMSSLLHINRNFLLVVDDFFGRTYYKDIIKVLGNPSSRISNAAIFDVDRRTIDFELAQQILDSYFCDPR